MTITMTLKDAWAGEFSIQSILVVQHVDYLRSIIRCAKQLTVYCLLVGETVTKDCRYLLQSSLFCTESFGSNDLQWNVASRRLRMLQTGNHCTARPAVKRRRRLCRSMPPPYLADNLIRKPARLDVRNYFFEYRLRSPSVAWPRFRFRRRRRMLDDPMCCRDARGT